MLLIVSSRTANQNHPTSRLTLVQYSVHADGQPEPEGSYPAHEFIHVVYSVHLSEQPVDEAAVVVAG